MSNYYIGLMSGTSMDGIDAVLAEIGDDGCRIEGTHPQAMSEETLVGLRRLVEHPEDAGLDLLGRMDVAVGREFASAVAALLDATGRQAGDIEAIGTHGQTVLHSPRGEYPFTIQIGDPNVIAATTGIKTVADFRRRDIALGGQGAPLVPAFHKAAFGAPGEQRAVLNLGGIANLTLLPAEGEITGFDTGPGNTLMDGWIRRNTGQDFDRDGEWAASAEADECLLAALLDHDYFDRPAPKSTGVEEFNVAWMQGILDSLRNPISPDVVQATLCELTSITASDALKRGSPGGGKLYVCGGGAYNRTLMTQLTRMLPEWHLETTDTLGIGIDWVEAAAFAWLAYRTVNGLVGNVPAVTGASDQAILGACYVA